MSLKRGRGYVYRIEYHLVWCVNYRHAVLEGEVADALKVLLTEIAAQHEIGIEALEVMPDHVHLLVSATPQHFIPDMVKALKGASARKLFVRFPELKKKLWGGHLWNPSYFVATLSENTRSQVKQYIESQHAKE